MMSTPRLDLREFNQEDAPMILKLLRSSGWIQFIGEKNVHTLEDAREYIQRNLILHGHGLGMYCVVERESGLPIGMVGFNQRTFLDHPDLGYALLPEFTGKGYARESASMMLDHARKKLDFTTIFALTHPENQDSISLLKDLGFHFHGMIDPPGSGDSWLFRSGT
ncbi:MAG: GNAT family N-acetyltransferase [Bacteroidota bacterium]|nr:GNAT family N-acetyltransferase [Bacteroidota bacterium]